MTLKTASILILASLPLTACVGTKNRGMESVHQPVVQRADYVLDIASDGNSVAPGEVDRLNGWFDALRVGYGDRIAVDTNGNYDANGVRNIVASVAGRRGMIVDGGAPVTSGAIAPGYVRVVISRMTASVPNCPDWSRHSQWEFQGNGSSNYGCATNKNLAAMVADPSDLVSGRQPDGLSAVNTSKSTTAVETHRKAPGSGANGQLKAEKAGK